MITNEGMRLLIFVSALGGGFLASVVTAVVNGLFERRQTMAEAMLTEEQAQSLEITRAVERARAREDIADQQVQRLNTIVDTWEVEYQKLADRYQQKVQSLTEKVAQLENSLRGITNAHTDALKQIEQLRYALRDNQRDRQRQGELLSEMKERLDAQGAEIERLTLELETERAARHSAEAALARGGV